MTALFLKIVNMSISASWLVLAVLGLRFALKKAPRWIYVVLWGIVALRLLLPISIKSALSLIPSAGTVPQTVLSGENTASGLHGVTVLCGIWLVGAAVLAGYAAISDWRLRRRVASAVMLRENIFQSETVGAPFVLGIIRPKIFLPFKMDAQNLEYAVAHEMAHIRRRDHWWKPLGFLLLTIHWFNPLMWCAYVLLCRDIELACDEKVIRGLDCEGRADYTQALVACSVNRRMLAACPLAFGEVGVKTRVKSVMNYKKPACWVIALAIISCAVAAVCFLTDPKNVEERFAPDDFQKIEAVEGENQNASGENANRIRQDGEKQMAEMEAEYRRLEAELEEMKAEYRRKLEEMEAALMKKAQNRG